MGKILILFFVIVNYIVAQSNFVVTTPEIFSTKPHHDFGEVLEGQVVTHTFEIGNSGTGELRIEKVRASCGCTAVQPASKLLKPGEKTSVKVEFDTRGRLGYQQKLVYVFTNDPKTPQLKLSFSAVIVEKLSVPKGAKTSKLILEKNLINFGNVEEGKVVDAKIGFQNKGEAVLEIIDVRTSCGCAAALLSSRKLKPGEKGNVKIELDTSGREGKFTRTVSLFSNDPNNSNQTITLTANIQKRK